MEERRAVEVVLIAAVARNGTIGKDNALLWRLPEDLQHFKRTTLGHPVVMGRKTFESIGRPLPGRRNIVVTRNPSWAAVGTERAASLDEALQACRDAQRVFVIGGGEIYTQALPLADELVLTEVDADFDGDASFPPWNRADFERTHHEPRESGQGWRFAFNTYRRRQAR